MIRTQLWSFGGGVQSAAIAALICSGRIVKPDLAVIADTGYEMSTTWSYMDSVIAPALKQVGVELHRIAKSDYATVDLMRGDSILIPAFTTAGSEVGKLPTYCSNEWKQRVVRRWATAQGVTAADIWIGFSTDELRRITQPIGKWQHKYPLVDLRMRRSDCLALVERIGWPEPPRSSCWMCPNKSDSEWAWQKRNAPDDFERAVAFQDQIQTIDPDLWLTRDAIPIENLDFENQNQIDFLGGCTGHCFT